MKEPPLAGAKFGTSYSLPGKPNNQKQMVVPIWHGFEVQTIGLQLLEDSRRDRARIPTRSPVAPAERAWPNFRLSSGRETGPPRRRVFRPGVALFSGVARLGGVSPPRIGTKSHRCLFSLRGVGEITGSTKFGMNLAT